MSKQIRNLGVFLAVYFTPVSYPWTVFSVNLAFAVIVVELVVEVERVVDGRLVLIDGDALS